jgi:DNA-binding transcriptional LysR family regulator
MTFGQLRTFVAVAREGSVRRAASLLVVTEPSVSAALAALKRELGVDLVERVGRGIRLTPAGQELAGYAEQILGLADRAARAVKETAGGPGHLRLVAVTTAGEYVLPPLIAAFRESRPRVRVSLEVTNRSDAVARLRDHGADLAVGGRPQPEQGIAGEVFLDNRLIVIGPRDHPLAGRNAAPVAALSGETWLLREPGSGTRAATEEFLEGAGIEPRAIMTIGSNGAIRQAAAVGLGLTLISEHAVADDLVSGRVVRIRVRGTPLERPWYVLRSKDAHLPPAAQAFLDFLLAQRATGLLEDPFAQDE